MSRSMRAVLLFCLCAIHFLAVVWWVGLKKDGSLRSVPDTRRNGGTVGASGPPPHFSGDKCIPDGHLIRENDREDRKARSVGLGGPRSSGTGFRGLRLRGRTGCRRPFFSPGAGFWEKART